MSSSVRPSLYMLKRAFRAGTRTGAVAHLGARALRRTTAHSFSTFTASRHPPLFLARYQILFSVYAHRAALAGLHTSASVKHSSHDSPVKDKGIQKKPETRSCWKCSTSVPYMAVVCTNLDCKVVQTLAPGANYYEILGLSPEPTFDVETKDLRNKFLRIQQQVHPDSYSQNTNGDQIYAQQQSSLANKAYSTLKEPLSRANYILELLGASIHETESLDEPELLMEVMEARELLEDAQTEQEVEDLKSVNDNRIKQAVEGLSCAFQKQDLEAAKTLAIELQYWIRIQNVIRDWAAGKPIVADHV